MKEAPELDEYLIISEKEKPSYVGFIVVRKDNIIEFACNVLSRLFKNLSLAVASEKITYVRIFGTKLKWQQGTIFNIHLSTEYEED